jgi:hypothetical protein
LICCKLSTQATMTTKILNPFPGGIVALQLTKFHLNSLKI